MSPVERRQTQAEHVETLDGGRQHHARPYSPLQLLYLARLQRLLRLRRQQQTLPTREEWVIRALDRVIYSALCDCIDQGVGQDARLLLKSDSPAPSAQSGG